MHGNHLLVVRNGKMSTWHGTRPSMTECPTSGISGIETSDQSSSSGFLLTWFGSQTCWCTTGTNSKLASHFGLSHNALPLNPFYFDSADEKFDGSFPTNVIVSDTGLCSYLPPGIFKVFPFLTVWYLLFLRGELKNLKNGTLPTSWSRRARLTSPGFPLTSRAVQWNLVAGPMTASK